MLEVTDATKTEYLSGYQLKTLSIVFPDANVTFTHSDISNETLRLDESIEDNRHLTFTGCISSKLVFKVADIVQDLRGQRVVATLQAGQTEVIPLFTGYVDEQTNLTHQDVATEFTCYDILYKLNDRNMQSWLSGLTYPITVKNFRDSLFNTLSLTQETTELLNDNLTITSEILDYLENPTARELMQYICQINARYGQIGRDTKFHYRKLKEIFPGTYPWEHTYPSSTTYPGRDNADISITTSQYANIRYEPFKTEKISKVVIVNKQGNVGAQYGTGTNIFSIQDNPVAFCLSDMATAAQAIYNEIHLLYYLPVTSYKGVGLPFMECGDVVRVLTRKNNVATYILSRTLKGIQGLFDQYESSSDQYQPEFKQTDITTQNSTKKKLLDNIRQTETITSEVFDEYGHSIIRQQAAQIALRVELGKSYSGMTISANGIRITSTGALQISAGNFQLDNAGNITCIGGTLGGFQITTNRIMAKESEVSAQNPGIMIRNGAGANVKALAIGYTSYSSYADANFYVNGNGEMHATSAYVKGEIHGDSGDIAKFTIGTRKLSYDGDNVVEFDFPFSPDMSFKQELFGDLTVDVVKLLGGHVELVSNGNGIILDGNTTIDGSLTITGTFSPSSLSVSSLVVNGTDLSSADWETITYLDNNGVYQTKTVLVG